MEAVSRLLADLPDIGLHYCSHPTDAIKEANRIKPTVILQDLVMPSINGLDLVRLFRANRETAEIPIIVLSSEDGSQVKSQAFAVAANDYLVKSPDKTELIARRGAPSISPSLVSGTAVHGDYLPDQQGRKSWFPGMARYSL